MSSDYSPFPQGPPIIIYTDELFAPVEPPEADAPDQETDHDSDD